MHLDHLEIDRAVIGGLSLFGGRGSILGMIVGALIVGVFSFAFHMSYSGILQILDFAAMFVFVGLTLSFNLVRLGWLRPEHRTRTYVIAVIVLTAITFGLRFTSFPIQLVTPILILATVVTEVIAGLRQRPRYAWFAASLGLLLTATAFSIADASRAMCDPHDHIVQGHAIWHVLSALSLACACRFYEQFRARPASATR